MLMTYTGMSGLRSFTSRTLLSALFRVDVPFQANPDRLIPSLNPWTE